MKKTSILICFLCMLASCSKPMPQFPANKNTAVDSTNINLQKMNELLAKKEDGAIQKFVNAQKLKFQKIPCGIWIYKEVTTNNKLPDLKSTVNFDYKCFTLNGQMIEAKKCNIHFSKKETTTGLEEALKLIRTGEKAQVIVPWYLAYGMNGKDNIPPYTSLIYEITVYN